VKVAFHAINGVGLGHLVRVTALAEEVRALVPAAEILVLTNAADTTLLRRAGLDFVKLPPRLAEPHADPDRVRRALPEPYEHAALSAALDVFRPDLLVFDTHAPLALARHAASIGARTALVLRELRPEALASFLASSAPAAFDRIVVPHEPGEVDLSATRHLPIVTTGPVVRRLDARARPSKSPFVVIMAGGGGQPVDARRFLRAAADAHMLARARVPALRTLLVTGPYGAAPAHLEGALGLEVVGLSADLPAHLGRATVVVSQAGYNAVAEIRALQKPAVLVPGARKSEDQAARAQRLVKIGAAVLARPEARSLADRLEALLLDPEKRAAMVAAHRAHPLVAKNHAAAEALLRPLRAPREVRRAVLIAHDFAPRLGGMETVAEDLAAGLLAQGVEVRVYTAKHLAPETTALPPGTVRRLYTPGVRGRRIDLWGDLLITLDALLADAPDAVHLCNAGLGPWVPALRAAWPAAVTAHVHGNDLLAPWVHHGGVPEAYRRAQIEGLDAAHAVIAVSSFSAALAREAGVRASRLAVIENGVDTARFSPGPPDAALRARLGIADDDEVILTVSRLAPRKGHATALRALRALLRDHPRALLVYTGEGARLGAELGALAAELGVAHRVRAVGFVSSEDLPALYRLARAFTLLSEESGERDVEGFGVALLEAAASGLPAVAARSGGMPEAVEDGVSGLLVPPADPAATALALASLLADPARALAMGERARARAVARFSGEARTTRVLDQWNGALARGVTPRPLRGFSAAFEGEPAPAASPRALTLREGLRTAASGVALMRLAQQDALARRAADERRRTAFARIVEKGRVVRLHATEAGARLLPDALADCQALGHEPLVELKLRRFVEPDFVEYAVPRVRGARLVHSIPFEGAAALRDRLASLPPEALSRITGLRLFLSREALASPALALAAVPEAHALRRLLSPRGIPVLPPPELMRYLSDTPAGGPETAMVEPTNVCNLACPTCPTGTGKIAPLPPMSVARFGEVMSALSPRLANLALWNYGEPLLHKELPAIIARAKQAGVRIVKVSSNAHFLDGERGRALLSSGLDVLILSVDGASQETYQVFRKDGDFARVAAQVAWICAEKKRLGQRRPSIELQFIAMRHNAHELPEIRRLAATWGVDKLRVKTVGAEDAGTRDLVPAERLLSRYREDGVTHATTYPFCTMAWDHTVVNVDGSVTPCCYIRPDMGADFVLGNVFERPFAEIWRGERYRAFRAAMLAGREAMPVCGKCRGGTQDLFASIEEVAAG
jgi:radical SAM protein with 4Fe4S-binding SPASM domain